MTTTQNDPPSPTDEKSFLHPLSTIIPSQLYLNRAKLETLYEKYQFYPKDHYRFSSLPIEDPEKRRQRLQKSLKTLPIAKINDKTCFTDGHHTAFVAMQAGLKTIRVEWDTEDLDRHAYSICVDWVEGDNITWVGDLAARIIEPHEYKEKWLDRCKTIF